MGGGLGYGLTVLAVSNPVTATVLGLCLLGWGLYELYDGGARAIYESGDRLVSGEGTAEDAELFGGLVGGIVGGAAGVRAGLAFKAPRSTGAALRRVGDLLGSVDDVLANPRLLNQLNPADLRLRLGGRIPEGWKVEALAAC